jgi:hypothetical protein
MIKSTLLAKEILLWESRSKPNIHYKMAGDMPERLNWAIKTFTDVNDIIEFGSYEGCSTVCWLACAKKSLICVDIQKRPAFEETLYIKIAQEQGIEFKFIVEDDLKFNFESCDLLFIDTMHTLEHTYKELMTHAHKVKKYLVFHDSNPKYTGVRGGIDAWLRDTEDFWEQVYNEDFAPLPSPARDCGLCVYERK